jgi:hypothetical protein
MSNLIEIILFIARASFRIVLMRMARFRTVPCGRTNLTCAATSVGLVAQISEFMGKVVIWTNL